MARQVSAQLQKEHVLLPARGLASHTAVQPAADHDIVPASESEAHFDRNFTTVGVETATPMVGQRYGTTSCPVFPRTCPFGGACHTCPTRVQAKLAINQPGDEYEQEADRAAEQVTGAPEVRLQRRATSQVEPTHVPPIVNEVLRSSGRPLDPATRTLMETRFDHDFGQVRVHTDIQAAQSAHAVHASAYTVGHDVVFGPGEYAPQSHPGERLLAHELTHVVQQEGGNSLNGPMVLQRDRESGTGAGTTPGQRLEFRPSFWRSLLGGPCACLVFIHNNEGNARRAAEQLHRGCRYNLAIIGPGRDRNVPVRGGNGDIDPNELFPANVQEECTRDQAACEAYERTHNDLRAMQNQFFLTIKACTNNFTLPTIALHNNSISDTRTFLRSTSSSVRAGLRGDFARGIGEGIGSLQDLRSRLGRTQGILSQSKTTNIFRWCNLPEISQCHIGDPDHPDNVVWVTNSQYYARLSQEAVNVVLQEGLDATSGSESETDLSTLFLRLGPSARYINIETPISPQDEATQNRSRSFIRQVIDQVGLGCCEPIGDFPQPSRTRVIA